MKECAGLSPLLLLLLVLFLVSLYHVSPPITTTTSSYVMVKNRTQQQLNEGISFEAAKAAEMDFFAQHPKFKDVEPHLFGKRLLDGMVVERGNQQCL